MSFIDNTLLNKTALACKVWDDLEADKLRRRLESKVETKKLLPEEWKQIIRLLKELHDQAEKEYKEIINEK